MPFTKGMITCICHGWNEERGWHRSSGPDSPLNTCSLPLQYRVMNPAAKRSSRYLNIVGWCPNLSLLLWNTTAQNILWGIWFIGDSPLLREAKAGT